MKSEHEIQDSIRLALSQHGICIRQQSGNFLLSDGRRLICGIKGLSDLLFIGHGYVAFIEVKSDKGNPTTEQLNFIKVMQSMGHVAGVVRSSEEALKLILQK